MHWGSCSQKKNVCNGGGCERKHEVVIQSEKEQNFLGAFWRGLKNTFFFLGDGQKKDKKPEKKKELKETGKKDCVHKIIFKEVTGQSWRGWRTPSTSTL